MADLLRSVKPPSDAELISGARTGDAQAYGVLYERHAPAARRLAGQLAGLQTDSEDIVAEAFTRILLAIRRGHGPVEAFRPYLLTVVRRVAWDQIREQRAQVPTDLADLRDPGEPFLDPAVASLERSLIVRAFLSLPERWAAVLWHSEIEQAGAAEVGLLLGLTPNGVAALRYRAREGLRQAYLQMHLSVVVSDQCRAVVTKLAGYIRGRLSGREAIWVRGHLLGCADCQNAHSELVNVDRSLRGLVAPVFLGGAMASYLSAGAGHGAAAAAAGHVAAAGGAAGGSVVRTGSRWLRAVARRPVAAPVAAATVAAAIALTIITGQHPGLRMPRAPVPGQTGPAPVTSVSPGSARPGEKATAKPGLVPLSPLASGTAMQSASGSAASAAPSRSAMSPAGRLSVQVEVSGLLGLGLTATVAVDVADTGAGPTAGLTASLRLPPGFQLLSLASLGGPGAGAWQCSPGGSGVTTCTHGPLRAGATASASFQILVLSLAGCGTSVLASVTSGALSAAGRSAAVVPCKGLL